VNSVTVSIKFYSNTFHAINTVNWSPANIGKVAMTAEWMSYIWIRNHQPLNLPLTVTPLTNSQLVICG